MQYRWLTRVPSLRSDVLNLHPFLEGVQEVFSEGNVAIVIRIISNVNLLHARGKLISYLAKWIHLDIEFPCTSA